MHKDGFLTFGESVHAVREHLNKTAQRAALPTLDSPAAIFLLGIDDPLLEIAPRQKLVHLTCGLPGVLVKNLG